MNELITIVEDDEDIRALLTASLQREHFRTLEFEGGKGLMESLREQRPSLLLLDVMLPDANGFSLCRAIRADCALATMPVIILTARAAEADRVVGLELGADDYVVKPFSPKEVSARVRAVLRRAAPEVARGCTDVGDGLRIDADAFEVSVGGRPANLTHAEFLILQLLSSHVNWVFSREKILQHLWGDEKSVTDRSVDVHIKHLREKLGPSASRIVNVRGVGYKLSEPGAAPSKDGLEP